MFLVRFTGHVGYKALEGLRKLGKQQLYLKDLNCYEHESRD